MLSIMIVTFAILGIAATVDLRAITQKTNPLLDCETSGLGFQTPIPSRPDCSQIEHKTDIKAIEITLWKTVLEQKVIHVVECRAKKTQKQCTVYFFGAQETSIMESKEMVSEDECRKLSVGKMTIFGKTQSKTSHGIMETEQQAEFPCTWFGTRSVEVLHAQVFESTAFVSKKGLITHSSIHGSQCTVENTGCSTIFDGFILLPDKKLVPELCDIKAVMDLACISSSHNENYVISCPSASLFFTIIGDPSSVSVCESTGEEQPRYIVRTVEGYLISLASTNQYQMMHLMDEIETKKANNSFVRMSHGAKEYSFFAGLEYSQAKSHLEYSINTWNLKTTAELFLISIDACNSLKKDWDFA